MGIDAGGAFATSHACMASAMWAAKKLQLLQQQTDVVAGAAHHGMQDSADRAFERIARASLPSDFM